MQLASRTKIFAALAALVFLAALTSTAQKKSAVFSPDKGKFTIQLEGQTVGHEEFSIAPSDDSWTATGATELKTPDAPTRVTGSLTLHPDGAPVSYQWSSQAAKTNGASITFANGVAKITLQMQGANRPFQQDLTFNSPLIAVLDNNLYYQYGVLARVYDWSKRGAQNLPVLIPQELTPGSITVESTGPATANGKSYEGLRVSTSDLEVLLFLDSAHRLMRLEVPAAKVSVTRD